MKECLLYINIILTIFLSIIVISLLCEKNKDKYSNNEVKSNKENFGNILRRWSELPAAVTANNSKLPSITTQFPSSKIMLSDDEGNLSLDENDNIKKYIDDLVQQSLVQSAKTMNIIVDTFNWQFDNITALMVRKDEHYHIKIMNQFNTDSNGESRYYGWKSNDESNTEVARVKFNDKPQILKFEKVVQCDGDNGSTKGDHPCPSELPICRDNVNGEHWGQCVKNPDPGTHSDKEFPKSWNDIKFKYKYKLGPEGDFVNT
jgi:hypothetical protein